MPEPAAQPTTMEEALAWITASLDYLDAIDVTQLPLAEQVQILQAFEELQPLTAAAYDNILGAAASRPAGGRHRASTPSQR